MRTAARLRLPFALGALGSSLFLLASLAPGQYRDEYGEISQTVARISYIDGSVSLARGDDPDNWQPADRNVPMTIGDRVYTGSRSRLELQVHGGDFVRLGAQTDLAALNLTDDTKQFSVMAGSASFQILRLAEQEVFEIDTPNAAVTVDRPGDYRVDVDQDGNTRVAVRRGRVTVASGGGQVAVQPGEEMDIDGIDSPRYDVVALRSTDGWDSWVNGRAGRVSRAHSLQYVSEDVVGVDDLDEYGRWEDVPQYGRVWSPTVVAADWVPYRVGHWIWQDPWGWTWVSAEPWGWAPYHYGRWVTYSSRWYWVPVAHTVTAVAYSPALVAFVGGGPGGWSGSVAIGGGGFVGWFPLGPRDPLLPWWSRRASVNVNVTNVTYVNRTSVTVVNQNTFVSGGVVTNAVVRDRAVLSQVAAAPVVRGPLAVVPTSASLRVAARTDLPAAPRPPAQVVQRAVVARVAPPPAPPSFQAKLATIRESRGAPVAPAEAAKISVENRGRAQAVTNVRPVTTEQGKVTLAPRGRAAESSSTSRVEALTAAPARGRPLATVQQPVSTAPVTSSTGRGRVVAPGGAVPQPPPGQPPSGQPGQPQPESWRGRTQQPTARPADTGRPSLAPVATPEARPLTGRGRENLAPVATPDRGQGPGRFERPTPQGRPVAVTPEARPPTGRGRENLAPVATPDRGQGPGRFERPTPQGRPAPVTPEPRPDNGRGRERSGPPPGQAGPPPQPQSQSQPERQVVRPGPQKVEQKKEEKGKDKDKEKKSKEQKKKEEEEKKPN